MWARQKDEYEELTTAIIGYARDYFEDFVADAWKDFHLGKVSESFNGKLRDECLNGEIFYSLKEAQIVIDHAVAILSVLAVAIRLPSA